ncbi:hypothetical protein M569_09287 [Genlisea aurea]|uniref:SHSP domain-containing protein n=1 Tax=Genlisea aurea TaxID=192259 RepID=S8CF05_9LAMI|nr:hypothetical protein M569_09287 [Genlisea aurea]
MKKLSVKRNKDIMPEMDVGGHDDSREKRRHMDSSTHLKTSLSYALPLLSIPKVEEWCSGSGIAFTGTASRVGTGPPIGVLDIGVSKSAYYFCIALPGVKMDPGEFRCGIQREGKVCVQGITSTGGKIVTKYSRVFEMKLQQQCPPGPFKILFSLPGPVDPRLFAPCFRSDGIFEGVVAKFT